MRERHPYREMVRLITQAVILMAMVCTTSKADAQDGDPPTGQIQAIVNGVNSPHHAHQADLILRQEHGVLMSRTDHNTRNILLHVAPDSELDMAALNTLLAPIGMSVRCVQRTLLGSAPFKHLDPRQCDGTLPALR